MVSELHDGILSRDLGHTPACYVFRCSWTLPSELQRFTENVLSVWCRTTAGLVTTWVAMTTGAGPRPWLGWSSARATLNWPGDGQLQWSRLKTLELNLARSNVGHKHHLFFVTTANHCWCNGWLLSSFILAAGNLSYGWVFLLKNVKKYTVYRL